MAKKEKKEQKAHESAENSGKQELARRFKQNPFIFVGTFVVLILVIVSFVLVPAIVPESSGTLSPSKLTFGSYDGKPIVYTSGDFFYTMQQRIADQYKSSSVFTFTYAFQYAAIRMAVLDTMKKSGYEPPRTKVDETVAKMPPFQENGRFSRMLYNQLDPARRLALWHDVENDLISQRYYADMQSIAVSSKEADFIGNMAKTQRLFKITAFPYSSYPDSEIIAYVEKNPTPFTIVKLSQISINSSESDAKKVLQSIQSGGKDFEEVARSQSQDAYAQQGGGSFERSLFELESYVVSEDDRAALAGLKSGEFSPVYKSPAGWIFFRADADSKPADTADPVALSKIRSHLMISERGLIEDWLVAKADNFATRARNSGFDAAAAALDSPVGEFGPLPINYGNSSLFSTLNVEASPALSFASTNENFWKTAFSTPVGQPSDSIILSGRDDRYVAVLFPVEETDGDDASVENIKNLYSSSWIENINNQRIEETILQSDKLIDNVDATYRRLMPDMGN
jgi:hypothetical protein